MIKDGARPRALLTELFHALHQPLTALRCSLELELAPGGCQTSARDTLESALVQTESITRLIAGIRELLEAEDPGDDLRCIALAEFLPQAVTEWQPLAEAEYAGLSLRCHAACPVRFEPHRLKKAVFHFLELLVSSASPESVVEVEAGEQDGFALITARLREDASLARCDPEETMPRRLAAAIVQQTLRTAGGDLRQHRRGDELTWQIRMPLSGQEICLHHHQESLGQEVSRNQPPGRTTRKTGRADAAVLSHSAQLSKTGKDLPTTEIPNPDLTIL